MDDSQGMTSDFDRENLNEDVERMQTLWLNEINAPEILPYDDEMVAEMLDQIKNQQEYVDSVSEDKAALTEERAFINKLYQMEIDRLKYMVSSYLRTRLRKTEKFAQHILNDPVLTQRLSQKEIQFAKQYVMLFDNHVSELALARFPDEHRSLTAEGMVVEPDLDSFVFCESKESLGQLQCDDNGVEYISMHQGDRHVVRYRSVKNHVEEGQVGLL
ncbi:hypothetical protein Poli38472_001631 [Pythium oligandrum]|uniref:DNA replication complex GINS protein SLD5 n=1 Tax=Pythium oligandrum TaxID=41045 RepID=A0A8K1CTT8_PYTOL|nr:hypothetical protein Poli38472_001631 [Pythium oligandrum]|eukprot:TMW69475.1 hypothetical protein Poli38472_001631 [Pythium oligandrum]